MSLRFAFSGLGALLLGLCAVCGLAYGQTGVWNKLADQGVESDIVNLGAGRFWPAASSGSATFEFGEVVFICGGGDFWFNGMTSSANSMYAYSQCCMWNETIGAWPWCSSSAFGPSVAFAAAWADTTNNQLWVFGGKNWNSGYRTPNLAPSSKLWRCNVTLGEVNPLSSWEEMTSIQSGNIPTAVFGPSSWVDSQGQLWLAMGSSYVDMTGGGTPIPMYNTVYKFNTATYVWTQVKGNNPLAFGSDGVEGSSYTPAGTLWASTAVDKQNNVVWMFGGDKEIQNGGPSSALWRFNMTSENWAKMNGDPSKGGWSYYFERNSFNSVNRPQAKRSAKMVMDSAGQLWVMGGLSDCGFHSELWVYSPALNQWAIVGPGTGNWHSHPTMWPGVTANPAMWISRNGTSIFLYGGMGYEKWGDFGNSAKSSMWRLDTFVLPSSEVVDPISTLPYPGLTRKIYSSCTGTPNPQNFDADCLPPGVVNQTSGILGNLDQQFASDYNMNFVQFTGYVWNFEYSPKTVLFTTSGEDRTQVAIADSELFSQSDAGAYSGSAAGPWSPKGSTPFRKLVTLQPGANKIDLFFQNQGAGGCMFTMITDTDFITNARPLYPAFTSITPTPPPPMPPVVEAPIAPPTEIPVATPESPVAVPVSTPMSSPTSAPVASPAAASVSTPTDGPTQSPVGTSVGAPVDAPSEAPANPPVSAPVWSPETMVPQSGPAVEAPSSAPNSSTVLTESTPDTSNSNSSSSAGGIAAGIVVPLVLIFVGLFVFVVLWRRKRAARVQSSRAEPASAQPAGPNNPSATGALVGKSKRAKRVLSDSESSTSSEDSDSSDESDSDEDSDESDSREGTKYGPTPAREYTSGSAVQGGSSRDSRRISKRMFNGPLEFKPEWMIDFNSIELGKKLGQGAFGVVFAGTYNYDDVAIKQCALNVDPQGLDEFKSEAILLLSLKPHPSIVQVLGLSVSGPNIYMIMEYCKKGSLDRYLEKKTLSTAQKIDIIDSIARGLVHLHHNNVVHRDLAARNILLGAGMKAKISDFGMSRIVDKFEAKGTTAASIGPIRWMAPESLKTKEYSLKSDIWSFAIVIYEIWTGHIPWVDETDLLELAMRIRGDGAHPTMPDDTPDWLNDICNRCWARDPADRPSMADIAVAIRTGKQSMSKDD